jgi:molybdopterin/thiamine biosynthesis adenylyltransferase
MRNATILVVRLRGVATEAIKNMVLAGTGKLIIMDSDTVSEEDLGTGFFFRDEDVGQKVRRFQLKRLRVGNLPVRWLVQRLDAAKSRIESLNPLVTVETVSDISALEDERFESIVKTVDLVCVTDWDERGIVSISSNSIQTSNIEEIYLSAIRFVWTRYVENTKSHFMLEGHMDLLVTFFAIFWSMIISLRNANYPFRQVLANGFIW